MNIDLFLNNLDVVISVATVTFAFYIFLRDPIRRWEFVGYLPKLIIVPIDLKNKEILFVNPNGFWGFVQGGISGSDLRSDILDVVHRDIGLDSYHYKLIWTKIIGTKKIISKRRLRETHLGGVRLFKNPKGKSYIAIYILVNKEDVLKNIKLGYGIEKFKFVEIDKALKFLKDYATTDKSKIYEKTIQNIKEAMKFTPL
ncbi:hypothetical protein CO058_00720 [candidate division WWE3 bacterium CG_4_9_14_0_2_um_filter_35_11]|uniref:Nudix hydrolase domain-containing protein n=1 Tax=candidate division WWE3 bacterium CG_4_9_14_0_2_um_filter_35_11 TaxID=1975077 RepID=A0A2M8EMF4_UNCKA|nr:MAG: hypothetical protein COV25_02160 [candidate division WWE3 bacterium CG10_big_fil_rev_8_21_14_0_10_35_32]PJC23924.1 MAG: hypothetical protein CO058_00720 [candidate division WWE3 bacterium CG_4_9_14_0_2_um_filter_35_11]